MNFKPQCLATAAGAFPQKEPAGVTAKIFELLPEMPLWPQLPNSGVLEESHVQFSEGLPNFVMEPKKKRGYFDTVANVEQKFKSFRSRCAEPDWNYFALSREYAPGFFQLTDNFNCLNPAVVKAVKGQITGPLSFGIENCSESGEAIIENDDFFEVIIEGLTMKARWQARELKKLHPEVVLFINESAFDAALADLEAEHIIGALNKVIAGIHEEGATAGIYVPGECEWTLIMDTRADILGFNAYEYTEPFIENPDRIAKFIQEGRSIAWGIVPAASRIMDEDAESLLPVFEETIGVLEGSGISKKKLLDQSLLISSDGHEKLSERESNKVLFVLHDMSRNLREKYYS